MAEDPPSPKPDYCAMIDLLDDFLRTIFDYPDFSVEFRIAAVKERNRLIKLLERFGPLEHETDE